MTTAEITQMIADKPGKSGFSTEGIVTVAPRPQLLGEAIQPIQSSPSTMDVQFDKLREVASYRYEPRKFEPAPQPFHRFLTKEFTGQHLAELFHENTKHRDYDDPRKGQSVRAFLDDESLMYATAKSRPDYPGDERIDLPDPEPIDARIDTVLASRRSKRQFTGEPLSNSELATLLGRSLGVTGKQLLAPAENREDDLHNQFRAYPSGGGLYPIEHYVLLPRGNGDLDPGVYYYAPDAHVMRQLYSGGGNFVEDVDELFLAERERVSDAAVILCMTGNFWRSMAKYGDRGYRLALQESGHAGQNVLLVAEAMGLGAVPYDGFDDCALEDRLGIDGVDESSVYTIMIGYPQEEDDV